MTQWLEEHGYTTYVYRTDYGNHLVDGVDRARGLKVTLTVVRDGAADLLVRLSPCVAGPYVPPQPPGVWTPVDD